MYYQQGDVKIHRIDKIPEGSIKQKIDETYIVAHGESGNVHAIIDAQQKIDVSSFRGVVYLHVREPAILTHEEHGNAILAPNTYYVDRVKEFDPFEEEIRRVVD